MSAKTIRSRLLRLAAGAALVLSLVLLALAGTGPIGVYRAHRAVADQAPSHGASAEHTTAADPAALRCALTPGDRLRYRFESRRVFRISQEVGAETAPGPEPVEAALDIEGVCAMTVLSRTGERIHVRAAMEDARITTVSAATEGRALDVTPTPAQAPAVLLVLGNRGEVAGVGFPDGYPCEAADCWKDLLSQWQFTYPEESGAASWTAIEADRTGRFEARYELAVGGGSQLVRKTWGPYQSLCVPAASGLDANVTGGGDSLARLDPMPVEITGSAWSSIALPGQGITLRTDARFKLARIGSVTRAQAGPLSEGEAALAVQPAPLDAAVTAGAEAPPEEASRNVGAILERLASATSRPEPDATAEHTVLEELAAAASADNRAYAYVAALRDPTTSPRAAGLLLTALAASGTAAAQDGLVQIMRDGGLDPQRRLDAVIAVALVTSPGAELEAALLDLSRSDAGDIGRSALLLLAAVGRRVREGEPTRALAIESEILSRLAQSTADDDRVLALEAFGNLGGGETPQDVKNSFDSANPAVRAAAVNALCHVNDDAALDLLAATATNDESPRIRSGALQGIAESGRSEATPLLVARALEDADPAVRLQALTLALRALSDQAASADLLAAVMERETDTEVRTFAAAQLQTLEPAVPASSSTR